MGVQEPESVFTFADVYRWKNYREVPDQMTSMVKYPDGFVLRLTSSSFNGHPGPLLTFYGSEGTLEYNGGSFKFFHEPESDSFGYSTHSWPKATTARFRELMNLNEKLTPSTARRPPAGRVHVAQRRRLYARAHARLDRRHPDRPEEHRRRALRPPRGARRPHVQPVLQGRQAGAMEQDDEKGGNVGPRDSGFGIRDSGEAPSRCRGVEPGGRLHRNTRIPNPEPRIPVSRR